MAITTANYPDMVAALRIQWLDAFQSDDELENVKSLYKVESVDAVTGYVSSLDGFSTARVKDEGDDLPYLTNTQNYRMSWTTQTIGGMEKITWEMRKGDQYTQITDRIRGMARSASRKMTYDLTHRFTYAASTSYTDADGNTIAIDTGDDLALIYTAKTVPGSSTTYRNIVSGNPILSKTGLEAGEVLFATQMIDDSGEPQPVVPDTLVIMNDANTKNTALEYLNSTAAPDSANSGVYNAYKGKYRLVVLKFGSFPVSGSGYAYSSTYAKYWFLMDSTNKRGIVKILQEPMLIEKSSPGAVDFETQDWKFGVMGAYTTVWLDGKNIVGSKGDGS